MVITCMETSCVFEGRFPIRNLFSTDRNEWIVSFVIVILVSACAAMKRNSGLFVSVAKISKVKTGLLTAIHISFV